MGKLSLTKPYLLNIFFIAFILFVTACQMVNYKHDDLLPLLVVLSQQLLKIVNGNPAM
jgi:hypothetical protein